MTAFNPITPRRAVDVLEAAQLGDVVRILVDFAAAGLVKGYARSIETVDANRNRTEIRDKQIPRELWRRIVKDGRYDDVLSLGKLHLAGSGSISCEPDVSVTGIRFDAKSVQSVVEQHGGHIRPVARAPTASKPHEMNAPLPTLNRQIEPASPLIAAAPIPVGIPEGAVTVTVKQAMAAMGLGRTKINELMTDGTLSRIKVGGRTLIAVGSIRGVLSAGGAEGLV